MKVKRIIWLPEIEQKLASKHGVVVPEVEDVLFSNPRTRFVETGNREDEDVYAAYSQTEEGRYLIVFFILKRGSAALILSAREMDEKERQRYVRTKS